MEILKWLLMQLRMELTEFIEKPFSSERLLLTVKRSIETFLVKNENTALKEKS